MNDPVLTARVINVDRIATRDGKVSYILTLDCSYVVLLQITAGLSSNQVRQRKREKKGLSEEKLRLRTLLAAKEQTREVDVEIGHVNPFDADAIVSIAEIPGLTLSVGVTLEFSLVRGDSASSATLR